MTQIPFFDQLGDAIEAAIARGAAEPVRAEAAAREPEPRRRSRIAGRRSWRRASLLLAALAIVGATAAIAQTLQHSTRLVTGGIACYAGNGVGALAYYNVEADGRSPQTACKHVFRKEGPAALAKPGVKLVACADPHGYVAVFRATGAAAQCGSQGMSPLQARPYAVAQTRVDRLVHTLAAVGADRRCIAPSALVSDTQRALDRLGWSGWRARLQAQPANSGSCGLFEGTGSSFSDPTASLDAAHRTVWIERGPIPSLIQLTGQLDFKLLRASGRRCHTPAGARDLVRKSVASAHVGIQFAFTQLPAGWKVAYAQHAYDHGCTIVGSITAAPSGRTVRAWLNAKSAPPAPNNDGAGGDGSPRRAPGA